METDLIFATYMMVLSKKSKKKETYFDARNDLWEITFPGSWARDWFPGLLHRRICQDYLRKIKFCKVFFVKQTITYSKNTSSNKMNSYINKDATLYVKIIPKIYFSPLGSPSLNISIL